MTFSLDNHVIDISCPQCGKKLKEKIGRMKREKHITCPVCGNIPVNTDQLATIERGIAKELAQLGRTTIKLKI